MKEPKTTITDVSSLWKVAEEGDFLSFSTENHIIFYKIVRIKIDYFEVDIYFESNSLDKGFAGALTKETIKAYLKNNWDVNLFSKDETTLVTFLNQL